MSEEQWHPIDLWIFRGWTINAVKGIREAVDIAEARRLSLMNRFFLWWKDGEDRTDIDLSAVLFKADWMRLARLAYFNLREAAFSCYHSGDIVDAPDGACEFIDMNIPVMLAGGVRYVAMCLNSFTSQPYCNLPECFAGWMARRSPCSGEVFEARTVQDKIDLASDTRISISVIFELEDRRVVWADAALKSAGPINIVRMARAMVELNRPNLYDLLFVHAEARGMLSIEDRADAVFAVHKGVTPFDTDKLLSEFLV